MANSLRRADKPTKRTETTPSNEQMATKAPITMSAFSTTRTICHNSSRATPGNTAVLPGVALDELWQIVRVVENALIVMGALVAICSLLGVVSVLLVGLSARRKELAIYRSLGAGPMAIFMVVAWESFLICGLAIGAGCLLYTSPSPRD